jgi:hypothetical protein
MELCLHLITLATAQTDVSMGILTDNTGCRSRLPSTAGSVLAPREAGGRGSIPPSVNSYTGGCGNFICSCDWPGTWANGAPLYPSASNPMQPGGVHITVYFTANRSCSNSTNAAAWGYTPCTSADEAGRLMKDTADATRCREACGTAGASGIGGRNFALFRFWSGYCHMFSWDSYYMTGNRSCPRAAHWLGSVTGFGQQGGITFVKGLPMPPPLPPPPSPPPPLPPQALTM